MLKKKAISVSGSKATGGLSENEKQIGNFLTDCVKSLRKYNAKGEWKGVHMVWTIKEINGSVNDALKVAFGLTLDEIKSVTAKLEANKVLQFIPAKGGVVMYLYGEAPARTERNPEDSANNILKAVGWQKDDD